MLSMSSIAASLCFVFIMIVAKMSMASLTLLLV